MHVHSSLEITYIRNIRMMDKKTIFRAAAATAVTFPNKIMLFLTHHKTHKKRAEHTEITQHMKHVDVGSFSFPKYATTFTSQLEDEQQQQQQNTFYYWTRFCRVFAAIRGTPFHFFQLTPLEPPTRNFAATFLL